MPNSNIIPFRTADSAPAPAPSYPRNSLHAPPDPRLTGLREKSDAGEGDLAEWFEHLLSFTRNPCGNSWDTHFAVLCMRDRFTNH